MSSRTLVRRVGDAIPEVGFVLAFLDKRFDDQDSEAGLTTTEWVILTTVVAALAIAAATLIYTKVINKANNISTGTPQAPPSGPAVG